MMKKKLSRILFALIMVALLVVPAVAQNLANHVTVAPNYKGDLLIYPVYAALDGLDTNFTVINTSNVQSTVVKVVFRSWKNSLELLDFLIYLSPNDVFKCTLSYDGQGYVMSTTDDSLCDITGTNPTEYVLNIKDLCPDDMAAIGYVEMFEAKSYNLLQLPKGQDGRVEKADIFAAYGADLVANNFPTVADTPNIITGYAELVMPGVDYADYQALALENYDNLDLLTIPIETLIGTGANNTRCEVEAALAKTNLVIPYFTTGVGTIPLVTFPTKLTVDVDCTPANRFSTSPFFSVFLEPTVHMDMYDLEEKTVSSPGCTHSPCDHTGPDPTLPDEVNLLIGMQFPFSEGWSRFSFAQTTTCDPREPGSTITFGGAPAVPLVFQWSANGLSILPVAFDYATVTYNGVNVTRQYQTGASVADVPPAEECGPANLGLCADAASCAAAGGNWCDGACQADACAVDCSSLDQDACSGDCVWSAFPNPVCMLNCAQFTDQASCEAGLNAGCQWNSTAFGDVCAPK